MGAAVSLGELYERGVWRAPYLVKGLPALIAVDGRGVARKHTVLNPGDDAIAAVDRLLAWLDVIDPADEPPRWQRARLELVRSKPRGPVVTLEDPYESGALVLFRSGLL